LKEIVEGEERVQTYEGESLEQILEQNPELSEEVGLYGGHQGYAFGAVPGLSLGPHGLRSFLGEESVQVQRTDVLGVYVRPLSAEEARARGLAQDAGLFVQGVEPRTIAHAVGLMPGDVLTELGGELVSGSEDIARALSSRAADSELRVAWVSADGRRESRTWAPERDEAGAAR
jgi:membrane-associated protease RseP (regulator of RpoE activity)